MEPERMSRRWEELLSRVRKLDVEGARSSVGQFCAELKAENCYKDAKIHTLALMLNLSGELKRDSQVAETLVDLDYRYLKEWEEKAGFDQFCDWVQNDVLIGYLKNLRCVGQRKQKIAEMIEDYIERNYGSRLTLEELAEQVYLSPYYLTRVFREATGYRLFDYLTMVRLQKAKEFLAETGCKITEVAQRVGFEDASYFGKVFRKEVGITPSGYRDLHQAAALTGGLVE